MVAGLTPGPASRTGPCPSLAHMSQYNAPTPPVAKPKVMPILHLVGGGLKALGLLFILIMFFQLSNALNSMFGEYNGDGGTAMLVIAVLLLMAGTICSNVARWMDSEAQRRALRL